MKNNTNLHIFAKSILALVCLIAAQTVGAAAPTYEMNIYASRLDIKTNMSNNTREVTLRFALASPGKGVTIYIDRDNNGFEDSDIVYNDDNLIMKRDAFTEITFTVNDNFPGGKHNWAVKVKGAPAGTNYGGTVNDGKSYGFNTSSQPGLVRDYQNADHRYMFQYPKALAINTYCDSKYCGYSYVGEAGSLSGLVATDKTPRRMGSTQGIYVFGPNMSTRWSSTADVLQAAQNYGAFAGGGAISWWLHNNYGYFGPCHLSVDRDGYVYVCQNHPTNQNDVEIPNRIWRVPASQLEEGKGNVRFDCIMTTTMLSNAGVPKRVLAMSVGNIGNDKILYIISGTTDNSLIKTASLSSWKITENGNDACSLTFIKSIQLTDIPYSTNQKLRSPHCSVVPGNDNGDLWIFQKVIDGEEDKSLFAAIHFSPSQNGWTADYRIPSKEHLNISGKGTIGMHSTYIKDGLETDGGLYYLAMPSTLDSKDCIKVFRMYKDSEGWHRDHTYSINNPEDASKGFDKADAVAIDLANNIYFTSSKTGRLYVYALPKENEHTTSAPTTEQLNIPYKVTWKSSEDGYTTDRLLTPYLYSSDWLPTLSKEGYIFHGWYDESGNKVTQITRNITLTAKWTELVIDEKTLDNTPVINVANEFANGTRVNIKVNRKMQGGMFSSLCLPFDIEATTLANATSVDGYRTPLTGATIWTFDNVQAGEDGVKILQFTQTQTQTQTVPAYTPFLIKPVNDIAEAIYFKNVIISNINNQETNGTITHDGITFTGVINPVELAAGSNTFFLVSDNRLAIPAAGGATLGGLRGYFTNPSGSKLAIRTQQNTTTWLEQIYNNTTLPTYKILRDGKIYIIRNGQIYDLAGCRL